MLRPEELVVELRLGVVHSVEDRGVLHLHHPIDRPVNHLLALYDEGVLVDAQAHPAQPARPVLDAGAEARVVELPDHGLEVVVLLDQVGDFLLFLCTFLLPQDLQELVDVLHDAVVGGLRGLVGDVEVGRGEDLVVVLGGLLGEAVQVPVQGVDVVAVGDAVEGAVVEVGHLRVVLVDQVVEDVEDPELQLVLLEEGQDLLDAQALSDVLLRPAQDLQDGRSGDEVFCLLRAKQGLLVVVVEGVDPALAHVVAPLLQGFSEGALAQVRGVAAVAELDRHLLARRPLSGRRRVASRTSPHLPLVRPVQQVDAVQVARGRQLPILEVLVRHADAVELPELLGASVGHLPLLVLEDGRGVAHHVQGALPELQEPLVLLLLQGPPEGLPLEPAQVRLGVLGGQAPLVLGVHLPGLGVEDHVQLVAPLPLHPLRLLLHAVDVSQRPGVVHGVGGGVLVLAQEILVLLVRLGPPTRPQDAGGVEGQDQVLHRQEGHVAPLPVDIYDLPDLCPLVLGGKSQKPPLELLCFAVYGGHVSYCILRIKYATKL